MKKKHLIPYNIQFFAEGGSGSNADSAGSEGSKGGSEGSGAEGGQDGQGGTEGSGTKTFTQDEVNAIGTREKNQGKNSILKLFGLADEKTAKTEAEEFKKWKESKMTEDEKNQKAIKDAQDSASESEKRAIAAENKLTALTAGIASDSLDDALAIALLKVTEDKTLEQVFADMKKEPRYSGFFKEGSSTGGTGSSADHRNGGNNGGTENFGKKLAEKRLAAASTESKFFNN